MDFSELATLTQKDVIHWQEDEISKWLEFINLEQYKDNFREHVLNGKKLLSLNQQTIENTLGITKALHVKKIVKWTEKILITYRSYYENTILSTVSYMILYPQQTSNKKYQKVAYELCESGLRIGSGKGCHVHLEGKDINQRHAQIKFRDGQYLLQDLGSEFGTYVRIRDIEVTQGAIFMIGSQMIEVESLSNDRKLSMSEQFYIREQLIRKSVLQNISEFEAVEDEEKNQNGSILQSQNQTILEEIYSNILPAEQVFITFKVYNYLSFDQAISHLELQFESNRQNTYTIGRKKNNSIPFINDLEMSGNHAQIVLENNRVYLRDKQSKNGVWLRLSPPEKKSDSIILQNGMSVRFGFYNDYKSFFGTLKEENCQRGFSYNNVENFCLKCFKKYHSTMLIPCSHRVYCKDCIKLHCDNQEKRCPECKNEYWDYVEILS